jgi:predicted nucleotide-binding protein
MASKRPTKPATQIAAIPPSVDPHVGIKLLQKLIDKATLLRDQPFLKESDEDPWISLARDYLTRVFGSNSPNVSSVIHAQGDGGVYMGMGDQEYQQYLRSSLSNKIKLLEACIEQLQTDIELQTTAPSSGGMTQDAMVPPTLKVFVVHGHNHGMKEAVARFLERLGLDPVVLHEKPNAGRTIIEKFSDYAAVQFAVVLLTADDEGKARGSDGPSSFRARQNVILELGYFLGRLGRARVCALYEPGVEIPSDYQGVLFVEMDKSDRWRFDLVRELRGAGFEVDANRIFGA